MRPCAALAPDLGTGGTDTAGPASKICEGAAIARRQIDQSEQISRIIMRVDE
jgi:hypothetical protein